jgi:dehydrogenase/reductase SDR family protein 12
LEGKSFLVTGANSGIGFGTAKYLASRGGTVHMLCRNKQRGTEALEKIKEEVDDKCDIHLHLCDVSEPAEIHSFVDEFSSNVGALDILVLRALEFRLIWLDQQRRSYA